VIDEREKELVRRLQDDLPLVERPYAEVGEMAGMSEDAVIETIERWKADGTIRRLGAILRHQKAGVTVNAMGVWRVPEAHIEEVGKTMAEFSQVSHCYERPASEDWPYNLYTMIHARSQEEAEEIATLLSEATGMESYELLYTERELKKASMRYFPHGHEKET
jgi:DNA-binding Lrp family transcriptional regulator